MGKSFERLPRLCSNPDGSYSDYRLAGKTSEHSMLVYDSFTGIVYYKFTEKNSSYMCPYISENGKYCRFIDNEIVEIP